MTEPNRSRAVYLGIAGAALLVVAGGGAFWYATQKNVQANLGQTADMRVTVGTRTCDPMDITVEGGKRSFEIVNASDRPIEWEILDGVMVVAERENIAPGFRQVLTAQLQPGNYEITCGLLSNPRGKLTVTASDEAAAAASEVSLRKFLGPLAEYRVYLVMQGNAAVKSAEKLRDAIAASDLDAARAAWSDARLPYRRIEPLAFRISDLENAIDPTATYLHGREADAGFTGYHRIEYGLFSQNSTEGLMPVAERLVSDLETLAARLKAMELDPRLLLSLPGGMATQLAESQVPLGENAYAMNDLQDLNASVEGIGKLVALLRSVVAPVEPALDAELGNDLQKLQQDLTALKAGDDWPPYTRITQDQRKTLADDLARLSASLERLQPVIGMN